MSQTDSKVQKLKIFKNTFEEAWHKYNENEHEGVEIVKKSVRAWANK